MSNDITGNFNNYPNMNNKISNQIINNQPKETQEADNETAKNMCNPLECLNAMGVAQVSMTNPVVKKSVEEFLSDEEYVKSHVDFCDGLVENGYELIDAINKTDEVLNTLKESSTYKQ